ncbi:hypothetical protein [Streptomyces acidiscabies]|uniref:Uncharacterized protein n=1 Tax=Streptomyces acidiscabies TaxID=42234 RepID=A0A0L0K723_9ACTN|nr:hypothetical protein [Streptomyces acidiscabies]MBP5941870.1 hypothetical protein [Streptomyces sp. LBUM 1476]KND33573.1 hypothetical protein IQ63_19445 [Streptomyces acidiscabies]MBZ3913305.1 hypothetical protein [Streptomyces acidiscabies]MDX2963269.1 hypothetical protein [Streptomyces acidiscabies]MDX3021513.1 hypothetical protein [Streptomyces acidiscabies]
MSDEGRQGPGVNQGVVQYGGTSNVGNQAIGPGATAYSGTVSFQSFDAGRTAELLARVEELLALHQAQLTDPESTSRELRRLREELAEPEPEPGVVRRALTRLNDFVQPVTPLVVAVGQLAASMQGLPGF